MIKLLQKIQEIYGRNDYLFPWAKASKPLSDATLSKLIKENGYAVDVHGFRTTFRTWTQEQTEMAREVAEMALAHGVGDKTEQAYARSDLFEKRRKLMEILCLTVYILSCAFLVISSQATGRSSDLIKL